MPTLVAIGESRSCHRDGDCHQERVALVMGTLHQGIPWSHSYTEANSQVEEEGPTRCGRLMGSPRTCSMTTEFLSALVSES